MFIFHIMVTVINCISYTPRPTEMLLVDKRVLWNRQKDVPHFTYCCEDLLYSTINEAYDESNKDSFLNYSYKHFKCSSCLFIFHAKCFVGLKNGTNIKCPNLYCNTIYTESEIERFLGQLLLSYAFNKKPIKKFRRVYNEYKRPMSIHPECPNFRQDYEPSIHNFKEGVYKAPSHESEIKRFNDEDTFINILITGRMAHVLMDSSLRNILYEYIIRKCHLGEHLKDTMSEITEEGILHTQLYPGKCKAANEIIIYPRYMAHKIFTITRGLDKNGDQNSYVSDYDRYVRKISCKKTSEVCANHFFTHIFQKPDSIVKIEDSIIVFKDVTANQSGYQYEDNAELLDRFKQDFRRVLMSSSEAVFRELYTEYVSCEKRKGLVVLELDSNMCRENKNIPKMLLRMGLGTNGKHIDYVREHSNVLFKILSFFSKILGLELDACEICSVLKWFNKNSNYITLEGEEENSINILKWMFAIPIPPEAIELYVDTLINNYSPYLGRIYARYISKNTLLVMCNEGILQKFKDAECADDFKNHLFDYKRITEEMLEQDMMFYA
ncbi:hypothetical protein ENBRE01_1655 [Enteropsectra breve]|nr:hypothetical protein ENBRE01_1655 [Enteropsectra breve]